MTAVDEKEEALGRLGDDWAGGFVLGHGMDIEVLRRAGIEDADAVVVATDGDNTNIVIGQVAQKRFDIQCVVVRVLDPARAEFYRERGLRTRLPDLERDRRADRGRARLRGPARRARRAPDVRPDRRRRQGRREPRAHAAPRQARGDADRAARATASSGSRTSSSTRCIHGDATELFVLERAGIARPPDIVVALTGDDEDNLVICQLATREVRRREGDRARQRPAQPGALRPARDLADGLRDLVDSWR